jgi:hypothetical protein
MAGKVKPAKSGAGAGKVAGERRIAAPQPNFETQAYWDAAKQGRLVVKRCKGCGEAHHYPRAVCPYCWSDKLEWQECAGTGTIYSYSVMRRAPVPYAIAYVTLAEGPTMMSNIVDCDLDKIRVGLKVRLVFKTAEGGQPVPMFTLA